VSIIIVLCGFCPPAHCKLTMLRFQSAATTKYQKMFVAKKGATSNDPANFCSSHPPSYIGIIHSRRCYERVTLPGRVDRYRPRKTSCCGRESSRATQPSQPTYLNVHPIYTSRFAIFPLWSEKSQGFSNRAASTCSSRVGFWTPGIVGTWIRSRRIWRDNRILARISGDSPQAWRHGSN
jgi:hypothetical protein